MTDFKECKKCAKRKPIDEFYRDKGMADGRRSDCRVCFAARRKAWYEANRAQVIEGVKKWQRENAERLNAYRRERRERPEVRVRERATYLKRKFGLSLEEYDEMLASQGGRCAICRRKPRKVSLHVDHDPKSGRVRGLLCFSCNQALGSLRDDPEIVSSAVTYLIERDPEMERLGRIARERALALCS